VPRPDGDAARADRVLIIEDDPHIGDVLARYLARDGIEVEVERDGLDGLARALEWLPDLVVLDLMLPRLDGFEVFGRLRAVAPVPVIMLTAKGDEQDRVAGLEMGADDYVAKPFSAREVSARIRSVLRRARTPHVAAASGAAPVLEAGGLRVDVVGREARLDGEPVPLTSRELDLLIHLMSHPGRAFGRVELLEAVWGWSIGDTATVTVHVGRLRSKVEADPTEPVHLRTVRGVGYRWDP
jgi:DNA-binding response OmpR family regulator